ncbi:hypothetical protein evm_006075 [Chilo suppressalis]|nr:hypothetical protein evm_006075 [Chilo suppressalis]
MLLTLLIYYTLLFCLAFSDSVSHGFDAPKFLGTSNIRPPNGFQQASPPFSSEAWIERAKDRVVFDPTIRQYQGNPRINRDGYFLNGYQEHVPNVLQQEQQAPPNGLLNHQGYSGYNRLTLPVLPIQTGRPNNNAPVTQYKPNENFESHLIDQQQSNLPRQYEMPYTYDIRQSPIFTTLLKDRQNHLVGKPEVAYTNKDPGSLIPQIPSRPSTGSVPSNMFLSDHKIALPIRPEEFKTPQVDPVTTKDRLLASASNPVETRVIRPPNHNIQQWMSNPNIRNVLSTTKHKKRYLVIHPNGTIEHVDKLETITKTNPNYILMRAGDIMRNPMQKPSDKLPELHKKPTANDSAITNLPISKQQNISSLPLYLTSPAPIETVPTKKITMMKMIAESLKNKTSEHDNINKRIETKHGTSPTVNNQSETTKPLSVPSPTADMVTDSKQSVKSVLTALNNQTTATTPKHSTLPIVVRNITNTPANLSISPLTEITPRNNLTSIDRDSESPKNITMQSNITLLVKASQGPMVDNSKNSSMKFPSTANFQHASSKPLEILPANVKINDNRQLAKPQLNITSKDSTEITSNITMLPIPIHNISRFPPNLSSPPPIEIIPTKEKATIKIFPESLKNKTSQEEPTLSKYNNSIPSIVNIQDAKNPSKIMMLSSSLPPNLSSPPPIEIIPAKKISTIDIIPESLKNKTSQQGSTISKNISSISSNVNIQEAKNPSNITTLPIPVRNISSLPPNLSSPPPIEIIPTKNITTIKLILEPLKNKTSKQEPTMTKSKNSIPSTVNNQDAKKPSKITMLSSSLPPNLSSPPPIEIIPARKISTIELLPESLKNKTSKQGPTMSKSNNSIPSTENILEAKKPQKISVLSIPVQNISSLLANRTTGKTITSKLNTKTPEKSILAQNNVANLVKTTPRNMTSNETEIRLLPEEEKPTLVLKPKPIIIYGDNKTIEDDEQKDILPSLARKPVIIYGLNTTNDEKSESSSPGNESPHDEQSITEEPLDTVMNKSVAVPAERNNNEVLSPSPLLENHSISLKDNQTDKSRNKVNNPHKTPAIPQQEKDTSVLPTTVLNAIVDVNSNSSTKIETPLSTNVTEATISIPEISANVIPERKVAHEQKLNISDHTPKQILIKPFKKEEDKKNKIPGSLDIYKVNSKEKPAVWFRMTSADFFDKLTEGKDDYGIVYFFQIHMEPRIETGKTRTIHPNGTIAEELTKTVWENEEGLPVVTKTTKLVNP